MSRADNNFGTCSACRRKVDILASKCPWCQSKLSPINIDSVSVGPLVKFWFIIFVVVLLIGLFVSNPFRGFTSGEIEGAVHLYPSESNVVSIKKNIKEVVYKKTYSFKNSSDDVEFFTNLFPARSQCFKDAFAISLQIYQKYFDLLSPSEKSEINRAIDQLINTKPKFRKYKDKDSVSRETKKIIFGSRGYLPAYDWEFYKYISNNQKTNYPNIRIYCRYKDAIDKSFK